MALPFDLQQFTSEIVTGIVVFGASQLPKLWRAGQRRLRPDPLMPDLRMSILRAEFTLQGESTGRAALYFEVSNMSSSPFHLEQLQLWTGSLDGRQLSPAQTTCSPPRVSVAPRAVGHVALEFILDPDAVAALLVVARRDVQRLSTPAHTFQFSCQGVVEKRWTRRVLFSREFTTFAIRVQVPDSVPLLKA